jgi:hypothetical protein
MMISIPSLSMMEKSNKEMPHGFFEQTNKRECGVVYNRQVVSFVTKKKTVGD